MFKHLDPNTFVSGQISPADVAEAAKQGITLIVNNRPDGERPDQPLGSEIEAAAKAAGVDYRHIPVSQGFSPSQVEEMAKALASSKGPVVAFCASGTRSTYLWALARASEGADGEELIRQAADAGYDLSPLSSYLR